MQVYMEQITDLIPDGEEEDEKTVTNNTPMVFTNRTNYQVKDVLSIREDPKTGIFVKGLKQIVKI
jgi:hypothetical protein